MVVQETPRIKTPMLEMMKRKGKIKNSGYLYVVEVVSGLFCKGEQNIIGWILGLDNSF
jgi:hypothetical protein